MDPAVAELLDQAEKASADRKRKRREEGEEGADVRRSYTREVKLAVLRHYNFGTQLNDTGVEVPISKYAIARLHNIHITLLPRRIRSRVK